MEFTKEEVLKKLEGTPAAQDERTINVNGKETPMGIYNLLILSSQCKLYAKGITPHRGWRFGNVKKYFGVTGNRQKVADTLEAYKYALMPYLKNPA